MNVGADIQTRMHTHTHPFEDDFPSVGERNHHQKEKIIKYHPHDTLNVAL